MNAPEAHKPAMKPGGQALPASGGPRPFIYVVQPLTTLAALQKLLLFSCKRIVGKHLGMQQTKATDDLATFAPFAAMLGKPSFKMVGDADVSLPCENAFQNVEGDFHVGMVEAAGVEPASEKPHSEKPTCLSGPVGFAAPDQEPARARLD